MFCERFISFANLATIWLVVTVVSGAPLTQPELIVKRREVESAPPPSQSYIDAKKGPMQIGEKIRTKGESLAVVRLTENEDMVVGPNSEEIVLISEGVEIRRKAEIFIHSRKSRGGYVKTPTAETYVDGTQYRILVRNDGTTTVTMIEGAARVSNAHGWVELTDGQEAVVQKGKKPKASRIKSAMSTIQWCLYYPAVLHLPDLNLTATDKRNLRASIQAYEQGSLAEALERWPIGYRPKSNAAKVYRAMVILSAGEVSRAQTLLKSIPQNSPGRAAVEKLIQAVIYDPMADSDSRSEKVTSSVPTDAMTLAPLPLDKNRMRIVGFDGLTSHSASEWLAWSYYEQSRVSKTSLNGALEAAKEALRLAPQFGFAAVRVAELEFSFGRNQKAWKSLEEGLGLTPKNAQGLALKGFILSGWNQHQDARLLFEEAIEMDSGLGNAWLGLGLSKIRQGELEEGRRDLQTAVVLEPNRVLFHAYLGKALSQLGLPKKAFESLEFSKLLDENDPTPYLYSALIHQEHNELNRAIHELNESIGKVENRRLYRSQALLDQDRAVRSGNLAAIYQGNGMTEVAVREATRAVEADYTNPSAHLFLANAFDALRDPSRIELRYETPWFHELLMANLLSPVGGGQLSQFVSQHEYSKLFEEDGIGASFLALRQVCWMKS